MLEHLKMKSDFCFPVERWKYALESKVCVVKSFDGRKVCIPQYLPVGTVYDEHLHSQLLLNNGDYVYVLRVDRAERDEDHWYRGDSIVVDAVIPSGRIVSFLFQQKCLYTSIMPAKHTSP